MKKLLIIVLALVLAGCAPVAPAAQPTAVIPPTPIVVTVQVPVVQTQIVVASPLPTNPPAPTATLEPPTLAPTTAPTTAAVTNVAPPSGSATATLPANAGGAIFQNLTRSSDIMYLRCQPQDIVFGISSNNPYVVEVDFYYRIEDRLSVATISDWKNAGPMKSDKNGNFTLDFNASAVNPDLRSHKAWFDYEFIGVNKTGDVVGRSAIIPQQITYKIDCSD
jgi:hypothetical protein